MKIHNKNILVLMILMITVIHTGCKNDLEKQDTNLESKKIEKKYVPIFNEDSAYNWIVKQVAFGPRVPNTKAHEICGDYLLSEFKRFTKYVFEQKCILYNYENKRLNARNIIASFNPETNNRIFIAAHWDSRPYCDHDPNPVNRNKAVPGANDGASGVGIILELARQFSIKLPQIGVDLILFDAEDYGQREDELEKGKIEKKEDTWCLGSQYWSKNPHKEKYYAKYGILLDMVGAKDATFGFEGISMYYAPDIVRKVWNIASSLGYGNYFVEEKRNPITDDHLYINKIAKIPTINIVHQDKLTKTGFFPQWHTLADDMSNIDKNTLKAVGQTLLELIYTEK